MECKVIVLDFDGVVVESNSIKDEAFSRIFGRYPKHYETMMLFHRGHNHLSRQEKFKFLARELMGKTDYDNDVDSLTRKFERLTRQRIISCAYVKGAREFIDYFHSRLPLYVSSATPVTELRIILKARGLINKLKGVYGMPITKSQALKAIIDQERVLASQIIFIGDTLEDYAVAKEAGVYFVAKKAEGTLFDTNIPACDNLVELKDLILGSLKPAER